MATFSKIIKNKLGQIIQKILDLIWYLLHELDRFGHKSNHKKHNSSMLGNKSFSLYR